MKQRAALQAARMATPVDVEPHEALLGALRSAEGLKEAARELVAAFDADEDLDADEMGARVRAFQGSIDRVARIAKLALDADVNQRQVAVAERYGAVIGSLLEAVLTDLELSPGQRARAPMIVEARLREIETPSGGAA